MCDFSLFWPVADNPSTRFSGNLFPIVTPCASWRRFRKHKRKANHRFAFFHLHKQIGDLLFFCDSWSFLRSHISLSYDVVCACWKSCHWPCSWWKAWAQADWLGNTFYCISSTHNKDFVYLLLANNLNSDALP